MTYNFLKRVSGIRNLKKDIDSFLNSPEDKQAQQAFLVSANEIKLLIKYQLERKKSGNPDAAFKALKHLISQLPIDLTTLNEKQIQKLQKVCLMLEQQSLPTDFTLDEVNPDLNILTMLMTLFTENNLPSPPTLTNKS